MRMLLFLRVMEANACNHHREAAGFYPNSAVCIVQHSIVKQSGRNEHQVLFVLVGDALENPQVVYIVKRRTAASSSVLSKHLRGLAAACTTQQPAADQAHLGRAGQENNNASAIDCCLFELLSFSWHLATTVSCTVIALPALVKVSCCTDSQTEILARLLD